MSGFSCWVVGGVVVVEEDAVGLGERSVRACTPEIGTYTAVVLSKRAHVRSVKGTDLHERANMAAAECGRKGMVEEREQETESEFLLACGRQHGASTRRA